MNQNQIIGEIKYRFASLLLDHLIEDKVMYDIHILLNLYQWFSIILFLIVNLSYAFWTHSILNSNEYLIKSVPPPGCPG